MGQVLHGSARTTAAIRRALQRSEESVRALATRYGISPTTVQKWRKRTSVADQKMGPAEPHSTTLSLEQEAMIVAFRRHTLLPLDDCLYALQPSIPGLTRSSLHRCLQRHGISRLPDLEGDKPARKKFKVYPIGYFHMDIAEVRTGEGKLYLFVAIDRTSKFAVARLYEEATRPTACQFLEELLRVVPYPYRIHTLLTDNGIQFAEQPRNRNTILSRMSRFDMICEANGIEHRLTKPNHPWTNGQVERMNRTIKDATTKRYHYDDHEQLKNHLELFLDAYNHARRLKTLKGLTPAQFIWKEWQSNPELFYEEPCHLMAGLNT
jgi:transposase InsO family protein